jgi:hypothetical protein
VFYREFVAAKRRTKAFSSVRRRSKATAEKIFPAKTYQLKQ